MLKDRFTLTTSTASMCVFDPEALAHRQNDPPDWWSDFMEEIDEVNAGNVMIIGLGTDGSYETQIGTGVDSSGSSVTALIRNVSGCMFVGPGEEITGGGFQPSTLRNRTGLFLDLEPSTYRVTVTKLPLQKLAVSLTKVDEDASNAFEDQLLLEE